MFGIVKGKSDHLMGLDQFVSLRGNGFIVLRVSLRNKALLGKWCIYIYRAQGHLEYLLATFY